MGIRRFHLDRDSVRPEHITDVVTEHIIYLGSVHISNTSVAGATDNYYTIALDPELLSHATAAYFEVGVTTTATDGTQAAILRDATAGTDIATISGSPLKTTRSRSADILGKLVAGHELLLRGYVSVASTTAQTSDISGKLILVL
jgi:hypothetical protein